jgi:hypothetical protein
LFFAREKCNAVRDSRLSRRASRRRNQHNLDSTPTTPEGKMSSEQPAVAGGATTGSKFPNSSLILKAIISRKSDFSKSLFGRVFIESPRLL